MRVLVEGRQVREEWTDNDNNGRTTFKVEARRIAIMPYRIEAVTLSPKRQEIDGETKPSGNEQQKETRGKKTKA